MKIHEAVVCVACDEIYLSTANNVCPKCTDKGFVRVQSYIPSMVDRAERGIAETKKGGLFCEEEDSSKVGDKREGDALV